MRTFLAPFAANRNGPIEIALQNQLAPTRSVERADVEIALQRFAHGVQANRLVDRVVEGEVERVVAHADAIVEEQAVGERAAPS